jgi:hypothetical protein
LARLINGDMVDRTQRWPHRAEWVSGAPDLKADIGRLREQRGILRAFNVD